MSSKITNKKSVKDVKVVEEDNQVAEIDEQVSDNDETIEIEDEDVEEDVEENTDQTKNIDITKVTPDKKIGKSTQIFLDVLKIERVNKTITINEDIILRMENYIKASKTIEGNPPVGLFKNNSLITPASTFKDLKDTEEIKKLNPLNLDYDDIKSFSNEGMKKYSATKSQEELLTLNGNCGLIIFKVNSANSAKNKPIIAARNKIITDHMNEGKNYNIKKDSKGNPMQWDYTEATYKKIPKAEVVADTTPITNNVPKKISKPKAQKAQKV